MNFSQLHEQLRLEIIRRIERGVLTGTMLARQTGFDPAHISNFIRGKRILSLKGLDRVLASQFLSAVDLIPDELRQGTQYLSLDQSGFDAIPLVSHSTALHDRNIRQNSIQQLLHFPQGTFDEMRARRAVSRKNYQRFVAIRLTAADAAPMQPVLFPDAILVIDRHYNSLVRYNSARLTIYAVRYDNTLLFRYLDYNAERLILRPHSMDFPVEPIALGPSEIASDLIVGRVCTELGTP